MTRSRFVLRFVTVVALLGAGGRLGGVLAAEQDAKPPQSDAERIRGHWVAIEMWEDGKKTKPNGAYQFVFTEKELKSTDERLLSHMTWEYNLDPKVAPRHLDLFWAPTKEPTPAIYRFDGEKLRLRIPTQANKGGGRPGDFESKPGDQCTTYLAERGKPTPDGRPLFIPAGLKLANQKLTEELRKRVSRAAEMLEKERYAEFFKEFVPPDELREWLGREKKTVGDLVKDPSDKKQAAAFAQALRTMDKKIPVVMEGDSWAYFDLRDVHFNGEPHGPVMFFHRVDGAWCYTEEGQKALASPLINRIRVGL
jgi:uncharacterized protein (TIGR03067 family)